MKKLALALVCCASVAFFASCNQVIEHPEPSIAVISGTEYITGTAENPQVISMDDTIDYRYGFHVESNSQTKKELVSLKVNYEYTLDGDVFTVDTTIDLTGMTTYDFVENVFEEAAKEIILEAKITAVVTDVDNLSSTATIAFKIDQPATPLFGNTIEWVRKGANLIGNTEAEMANCGLQWTGSYKEVFATIRPLEDALMFVCNGDDYATITTDVEKYAYFTNLMTESTPVDKYRNITTNNSANYNDMLAVVNGDNLTLVLITRAEIETGNYGTQITIKGEIK